MLIFNRPNFRSGTTIVKEPDPDNVGQFLSYSFTPVNKGQSFAFVDEAYVLSHYSIMFTSAG